MATKSDVKPAGKPEAKPAAKPDSKPVAKPAAKPAVGRVAPASADGEKKAVEQGKHKAAKPKARKKSRGAETGAWGIDIGQCALKALRLQIIDGQVVATHFDYIEYPKILSQPDAEPDGLIREALQKFLSRNSLRGDVVAISVPGQSGLARFVKLPPVEEKKIADIVKFEARQQIPFSLDEVVWDYQKLGSGGVADGYAMEIEIGLFAMKRDMVNRYLERFQAVNVDVDIVQMTPLALCNYISFDLLGKGSEGIGLPGSDGEASEGPEGESPCVVVLDIGADSTNLVVTDGGPIIWQRPIAIGGSAFTRALVKELKLTYAKAEHVKRNAVRSPHPKQILGALMPVLNDFVNEVRRSLGYFTTTYRSANIAYVMGLGNAFRLPGLQKFLESKLGIEVRKLQKLERLTGDSVITAPAYEHNILSFGVAYGLALQGIKASRLQTNLMPEEIEAARLVRNKKPWLLAAAAGVLLSSSVLIAAHGWQYRAFASPEVQKAKSEVEQAVSELKTSSESYIQKKMKIEDEVKAIQVINAGKDTRMDWIRFHKYLCDALPRPDGSNLLMPEARREFEEPARKALEQFRKSKEIDPVAKSNIIRFNIEAIESCSSKSGKKLADLLKEMEPHIEVKSMRAGKIDEPPVGEGWVIALRGYVDHPKGSRDGGNYVINALVENLARLSEERKGKPDAVPVSHVVLKEYKSTPLSEFSDFTLIGHPALPRLFPGEFELEIPKKGPVPPPPLWIEPATGKKGEGPSIPSPPDVVTVTGADVELTRKKRDGVMRTEFIVLFLWKNSELAVPTRPGDNPVR